MVGHIEAELSEEEAIELLEWFESTMQPIVEALEKGVAWLAKTLEKLVTEV